ncbi:hypothetical protein CR513_15367, partial [Mucuna pruriens]
MISMNMHVPTPDLWQNGYWNFKLLTTQLPRDIRIIMECNLYCSDGLTISTCGPGSALLEKILAIKKGTDM